MGDYSDKDVAESLMSLMLAIRDTMELENFVEMKEVILERYNAEDSITQFNRNSIAVL